MIREAGKTRDDIHFNGWDYVEKRTALMVVAHYGNAGCVRILAKE